VTDPIPSLHVMILLLITKYHKGVKEWVIDRERNFLKS